MNIEENIQNRVVRTDSKPEIIKQLLQSSKEMSQRNQTKFKEVKCDEQGFSNVNPNEKDKYGRNKFIRTTKINEKNETKIKNNMLNGSTLIKEFMERAKEKSERNAENFKVVKSEEQQ